jgi:hypothetical protein
MQQVHLIKESIDASTESAARRAAVLSKNTTAVAAAAVSGPKILEYTRVVEDGKNVVSFALEEGFWEFRPDFAAENITTGELLRRLRDEEWQAVNPNHPIAYMAYALEAYKRLTRAIRESSPLIVVVHGRRKFYLALHGDRDKQRRLMRQGGLADAEIDSVVSQLDAGVRS